VVDAEVRAIVSAQDARVHALLVRRRSVLDTVAAELRTRETLQRAELEALVQAEEPPKKAEGREVARQAGQARPPSC
jgi:ATP-dependent Zn protease